MAVPENFYLALGLTRAATELEIAHAYRACVQKLQADSAIDATQLEQELQQLQQAYQTLLNPEKKKKHDEALTWHGTRQRLDSDKAMRLAQRLKDDQEAAKEAEKAAQKRAIEAARRAKEEATRKEEEARIHAEAQARFRKLREERMDFGETLPLQDSADKVDVVPGHGNEGGATPSSGAIGKLTVVGSLVFVAVLFVLLLNMQPGASKPAPNPIPVSFAPPAIAPPPVAVAPLATAPVSPPPAPKVAAPPKPGKEDSAKALEAQQYQKTLQRIEAEHPELNVRHSAYRADLMAFVTNRMQVHTKAGYLKPKALEIAVRDLETQDLVHQAIEKHRSQKEVLVPEAAPVADKGGHSGFDPKCRWLNAQEWSCK